MHTDGRDPGAACAAPPDEPILALHDLRVQRGGVTLVEVGDWRLGCRETHVLLGANGAGKSTLLRTLNGLEGCDGELLFDGRRVDSRAARLALRRRTAAVFQRPYLLATTVLGNVEQGLRLRGAGRDDARRRAAAALDLLGIAGLAERGPAGLSGGEAQRVSLARALACDPAVLFLDEPMAFLDPPTRRSLLADLVSIFDGRSTAVVWVTHDREEAMAVADRVSFMSAGRMLQTGPCADVFNRPVDAVVADFLGVETWLEGTVSRDADADALRFHPVVGPDLSCGEAPQGAAAVCLHPEDVALFCEPPPAGGSSLRNVLRGTVVGLREAGRLRYVTVACEGIELTALVTRAACEDLGLASGTVVYAAFKASAVQVISRVSHPA